MKKFTRFFLNSILCIAIALCAGTKAFASHIVGANLTYTHVAGSTYTITLTLFGDCGIVSAAAFSTLPFSVPQICVYDGTTSVASVALPIAVSGVEITPLCTGDTSQCTSPTSTIRGVEKFVYRGTVTLPHTSSVWRFIYTGNNGPGSAAGRAADITNLVSPGGTLMQLIDTLNNSVSANTSSVFNNYPPPTYPDTEYVGYYPACTDADGDSLFFSLDSVTNGTGSCAVIGGSVGFIFPTSFSSPVVMSSGAFSFNSTNGYMSFHPISQRAAMVYNVREFRAGVFMGSTQEEFVFSAAPVYSVSPCSGAPDAGFVSASYDCIANMHVLGLSGYSCAGTTLQWQSSPDHITWTNIAGATAYNYVFAPGPARYYRCAVSCTLSGIVSYNGYVFVPASSATGMSSVTLYDADSVCFGPKFYVSTCTVSSTYNLVMFYGDGSSDTTHLSASSPCAAVIGHMYAAPGTYYIREILYDGSVAVDSLAFSYEYRFCRILPLKFYMDRNSSCSFDAGDTYNLQPVKIEVDSNGVVVDTITATSGYYYRAYGAPGTVIAFRLILSPASGLAHTCGYSGTLYDTLEPYLTSYPERYFGLICTGGSPFDLSVNTIIHCATPGFQTADIYASNTSCASTAATLTTYFSPKYVYDSVSPGPMAHTGNSITWNILGLSYANSPMHFYFRVVDDPATGLLTLGDTVQNSSFITPLAGDADTSNNHCQSFDTVRASFDPNEMWVTPGIYISSGTKLKYTINFENVGNDTAHCIHIMDTLSAYLDPKSLDIVAASDVMNLAGFNDGTNNIVKFDYPNINLLDSSHHGQCDGMVIFTINTLTGLPDGTTIFNHAGIFFDDNQAVLTNTVEDIIGIPGFTLGSVISGRNRVEVYPNPATDELNIRMDQGAYSSFTITNTTGQAVLQQTISGTQRKVNIKVLPAGMYYVILKGENGTATRKFVKM